MIFTKSQAVIFNKMPVCLKVPIVVRDKIPQCQAYTARKKRIDFRMECSYNLPVQRRAASVRSSPPLCCLKEEYS